MDEHTNKEPTPAPQEAAVVDLPPMDGIAIRSLVERDTWRTPRETSEDYADRLRRLVVSERQECMAKLAQEEKDHASAWQTLCEVSARLEVAEARVAELEAKLAGISDYIEKDCECLMPIVVEETKHAYGLRLLKVLADEIRNGHRLASEVQG